MSTTTKFTPNVSIPLPDFRVTGWRDDLLSLASKADTGLGGTATAAPDGLVDASWIGQRVFDKTNKRWYTVLATGVATATTEEWYGDGFPAGTQMLFHQAAAPVGWTLATAVIDRALRLATEFAATATSGKGGQTGGSWEVSGLSYSHTHQMDVPPHKHETPVGSDNVSSLQVVKSGSWPHGTTTQSRSTLLENAGSGSAFTLWSGGPTTTATSAGATVGTTTALSTDAITSDSTWRPAYSNVIIATKT